MVGFLVYRFSMDRKLIFITGGTRSGKSAYALKTADALEGDKVFLATATAGDEEMRRRIEVHKNARPSGWSTIEEAERKSRDSASRSGLHLDDLADQVAQMVMHTDIE